MQQKLYSVDEMIQFGQQLASTLKGGDIVLLHGDLGAGKTTLTKGIAQGLGIMDEIVSPTFTLMQTYDIKRLKHKNIKTLVHIDTYRLKDEEQLIEIGVEDYLSDDETVCVIEWPEKIEGLLRGKKVMNIMIEHSGEGRIIKILDSRFKAHFCASRPDNHQLKISTERSSED